MAPRGSIPDQRDLTAVGLCRPRKAAPVRAPLRDQYGGMRSPQTAYWDRRDLKPRARNPRIANRQIKQIAPGIERFGLVNPVLVDGSDGIASGAGRVEAAKRLGVSDVPTLRVDHLTPSQVRGHVIEDNKLTANAGWDLKLLASRRRPSPNTGKAPLLVRKGSCHYPSIIGWETI